MGIVIKGDATVAVEGKGGKDKVELMMVGGPLDGVRVSTFLKEGGRRFVRGVEDDQIVTYVYRRVGREFVYSHKRKGCH